MKTMNKFLSMAALALVGAVMTGCSSSDDLTDNTQPQQSGTTGNTVTLTTTIGFDDADGTRALAIDYGAKTLTKTFAVGDQIALIYSQTGSTTAKAVSKALTAGDISAEGKSANFTFELTDPNKTRPVTFIYPAAMESENGYNWDKLNTQDGTLASIASNLDGARGIGVWSGDALPNVTLTNGVAIIAYTLKDETGENDITSTITGMTISDGSNNYTINGKDPDGHIYAAIWPTDNENIEYTATDGTKMYMKSVTGKTYETGQFYQVGLRMAEVTLLSEISSDYTAQDGEVLTGTLESNVRISIAEGATVTLKNVNITNLGDGCDWAGITCEGDATLVLEGTNEVCPGIDDTGEVSNYPGIYIAPGQTLTIQGDGYLTAYSNAYEPYGAGIGGGYGYEIACGNIVINSGNIKAYGGAYAAGIGSGGYGGYCGDITINGGTITAIGGDCAAGIGSGRESGYCGTITIKSTVTSVTAMKGDGSPNSIGAGQDSPAITPDIEDGADVTQE